MEPGYDFFVKHKNMLKYLIIFELLHFMQKYLRFSAIFGQIFVWFTSAIGSLAAFLSEIMVGRYFPTG